MYTSSSILAHLTLLLLIIVAVSPTTTFAQRPNFLMILVDDLKPIVGAYGDPFVSSPNLDDLFSRGLILDNHHVQVSECAPSRLAILVGLRPDFTQLFSREGDFRIKNPIVKTMPGYLRENGYTTVAVGKVFDWPAFTLNPGAEDRPLEMCPPAGSTPPPGTPVTECSWDLHIPPYIAHLDTCVCKNLINVPYPPNGPTNAGGTQYNQPLVWGENVPAFTDAMGYDSCHVNTAIVQMRKLVALDKPWMLAVGIFRPHLPWVNPEKYYNIYGDGVQVADAVLNAGLTWDFFHSQSNMAGMYDSQEIIDYIGPPGWAPSYAVDSTRRVRAYYASVSYGDEEIGRLIHAVDILPNNAADNILIVLWGDNGFHLGPSVWGKKTVYEDATRTPLVIIPPKTWIKNMGGPSVLKGVGSSSSSPTESIDLFPTVLEILGFPPTVASDELHLHGTSLVPLLYDPTKLVKIAAMSQYHSWINPETHMAYTLRTSEYRIIIYYAFDRACWSWKAPCHMYPGRRTSTEKVELYHIGLPGSMVAEQINVATDPKHADALNTLSALLDARTPSMSSLILGGKTPQPTAKPVRPAKSPPTTTTATPISAPTSRLRIPTPPPTPPINCHQYHIYADCLANPSCFWDHALYYAIACKIRPTTKPTMSPQPPSRSPTQQPTAKPSKTPVRKPTAQVKTSAPVPTTPPVPPWLNVSFHG